MQTFKTIVVVGTLLCVGWGAHQFMNKPIPNQPFDLEDRAWDEIPDGHVLVEPPSVDLSAEGGLPTEGGVTIPTSDGELAPNLPSINQPGNAVADGAARSPTTLPPLDPLPPPTSSAEPTADAVTTITPPETPPASPMTPPAPHAPPALEQTPLSVSGGQQTTINVPADNAMGGATKYPSTWSNGFEEMWGSVQLKLQSSQFVDALLALSLFYNDAEITGEQRDRMVTLLDQLAGTVIYSSDYHMEPAYVVQPGDTLASIAAAYSVPEALIARVNGITMGGVTPGTQLKVLRGPFRGELDVNGRQLTLFLGRYYAGRFSTGIGRDLPAQVGVLEVVEKAGPRAFVDRRSGQQVAAGAPENPYGNYWIGLRDQQMAEDTFLGIHSVGSGVDASDTRGCISVSDQDADDLQAILSAGSKISIIR